MGTLISYSLGALISWHWVAVVALMFPAVLVPGLLILSDSPYWYMQQGQEKKALAVMERFRASDSNVLAELLAISESLRRPEDQQVGCTTVFRTVVNRLFKHGSIDTVLTCTVREHRYSST